MIEDLQVCAPTTPHSDEETDNGYNTIGMIILEKQNHFTNVIGNSNAKVGGQTNTPERSMKGFDIGKRKERGRVVNIKEIQDHEDTISEEGRAEMDMEKP